MVVDLKLLRADIREKLGVKQPAVSNRVRSLKQRRPMSDSDALGVLARQVGLSIDKRYGFSSEDLARIGDHETSLAMTSTPTTANSTAERAQTSDSQKLTRAGLFNLLEFHPEVVKHSKKAFVSGLETTAVQRAFQGFHNRVKQVTRAPDHLDGESLLGWAFNPKSPQLQLSELKTTTQRNEQKGLQRVAQGSYQGFRNPGSHDLEWGPTNENEVLELLGVASFLHRCVDRCLEHESQSPTKSRT